MTIPYFLFRYKHDPILSAKNKVKITDLVYHNYVERTNEWENKLDSFDQKYCMNHENSTEVDSDLVHIIGKSKKKQIIKDICIVLVLRTKCFQFPLLFHLTKNYYVTTKEVIT